MLTETAQKLFTLNKLKGVGPSTLAHLATLPDFASATVDELAGLNRKLKKALEVPNAWQEAAAAAAADVAATQQRGARIISVLDADYPALLRVTPDRPFFLYIRGQWADQPQRSVAVIGTRHPTEHGEQVAERITAFLVEDGWSIVSGLALGCDARAHQTAMRQGGHTVAVLAHGLQTIAPKQHVALAEKILEHGGALVTEYGFDVEPQAHQYVKRDRIQAGLSRGVILIQSDREGGSLHASRAAIEYQRFLVVPVPTERDLAAREKKIEANELLVGPNEEQRALLLKCDEQDLRQVLVVRGKEDYQTLSHVLAGSIQ